MTNLIAALIILILFFGASVYIYKEKKKGHHCIGCPMAGKCAKAKCCSGKAGKVL